jgi:hypothetical protein
MKAHHFLASVFAITAHARAPILGSTNSTALLNSYIVVLKPTISRDVFDSHVDHANSVVQIARDDIALSAFELGTFKGYTVKASNDEILEVAESDDVRTRTTVPEKHAQ